MKTADEHPLVLFDGVCNLCNASINFMIDRDPRSRLRFAPLQSELGQSLLREHGLPPAELDSMVLLSEGKVYRKSSAALRIAQRLKWPWPLLSGFLIVPRLLRDPFYNLVARNRYRWFGRQESCRVPTPELRERFLG